VPEASPLDVARQALGDASGEAEVLVAVIRARRARAGSGRASREQRLTVEAMAARDGHAASSGPLVLEEDRAGEAVRAAEAALAGLAGGGPGLEGWPGLEAPQSVRAHEGHDLATAALSERELERLGEAALQAAPGADTVLVQAVERRIGLASTAGHALSDAATEAALAVTVAPVVARGRAVALSSLDPGGVGREAAERAALLAALGDVAPPRGENPAVLEHAALAEALAQAGALLFSGAAPVLDGRLGTRIAAPNINLSDSPRYGATLARAFDAEGVPKAPIPLVQDGVAHRVVHDISTAARAGTRSTGHATVAGAPRPRPRNLVLVGGGALDLAELVAPMALGLVVPLLSTESVEPTRATARMRAPWALEVREGKVSGRLGALVLETGLLELLAGAEALIARPRLVVPDGETAVVCPALRTARLRVL
jgi:predicted Zn-dependent protease